MERLASQRRAVERLRVRPYGPGTFAPRKPVERTFAGPTGRANRSAVTVPAHRAVYRIPPGLHARAEGPGY
jgi:hypothetical protein